MRVQMRVQDMSSASGPVQCVKSNDPHPNLQEGVTIATCPNISEVHIPMVQGEDSR